MINIHIIENNSLNAITWWRFLRPFAEMQRQFPGQFTWKMSRIITGEDLYKADVFILSRAVDEDSLKMVKRIKDVGRAKIIMDIDDAITNVPLYHDMAAYFMNRAHIAREIFSLCDYFWVTTEQLLYECDCLNRGEIIPNAIYPSDLPKEPAPDRGLWMWRGKAMQKEDVYLAGAEAYDDFKYKANKWIFWGCLPAIDHGNNIELLEYEEDLQSYFAKLKQAKFNGIWKPLVPNQFNRAKSNIAWIEATMSGGVCLTNLAGNPEFPQWQHAFNGFPGYDEAVNSWQESRFYIERDYNLEDTAAQRMASLESVVNKSVLV